jgi:hypothetical protein
MSQAGTRRDRSKNSDGESGVPSPENSAQSTKSASSPLRRIVFIQKVALFAGTNPKKALQLIYVSSEWRETVVDFTFDALFFDPFVKPLLQQQPPSARLTEKEKEIQQQNEKKKLEVFQQFRKVVSFVFQRVSAENKELVIRMKTFLAVLFEFVHSRNKNNDRESNDDDDNYDDDSNSVTNAGCHEEVASFLRVCSLCSFLRTDDLHDLIINHIAPRVTAIEEFGELINRFTHGNKSGAALFSNVESFSAMLTCVHRSKTSSGAVWIASSINIILHHNPSSNILLNSLPVVDAFSFIIPLVKHDGAISLISETLLKILNNNEEAQQNFATSEFLKFFLEMEKYARKGEDKTEFRKIELILLLKFLGSSTSPRELKFSVDSLPQNEKYCTAQVRDLIIAKKNLIVNAETADSVVKFLSSFSQTESRRHLLRTKEVRDLIINNIAPRVTAIYEFGELICSIVQDQQSAVLFSNVETFSAILKCFHRSKTSKDTVWIASSINNILNNNPSCNKFLNSLPVVEAFSFIIPLAEDAEAVRWISNALMKILYKNAGAQQKFSTPDFFDVFNGMEKYTTIEDSNESFQYVLGFVDPFDFSKPLVDATNSSQLKSAVDALPRHEKYFTEEVRDLLIAKKNLIVDAETADSVVKFLFSFRKDESRRPLLRTKEVQDLIITHIAPQVTAIEDFGCLICNIVQDRPSAELFCNVETFSAILKCFHRSKTSEDANWIASSIHNILRYNSSSNKLFNSLPVVEAFSFIIPLANDDDAVEWISSALQLILNNNEEAQKKFATSEFLNFFLEMEKYATTDAESEEDEEESDGHATTNEAETQFQTVELILLLKFLGSSTSPRQLKFSVDSLPQNEKCYSFRVRDLLFAKKDLIVGAATVNSVVNFLLFFGEDESLFPLFRNDDLHDLIINHIAPHVTAIDEFGLVIFNIVKDRRSAELFAKVESFSAILKCFHRSKTSDDAKSIAYSINNILLFNPSSNKLLNSLPVVEAFSFIIPLANDADAIYWISDALQLILKNNEEAQQKFRTPEFLKIFRGMEKYSTEDSNESFRSVLEFVDPFDCSKFIAVALTPFELKSAVDSLPRHQKYFTEEVRDLLIAKKDLIVDAETADSVVKFLSSFSQDASLFPLLQTEEVQDLIINNIAPHVTAIEEFGELICEIVQDRPSAKLFSNVESFSAILKCFHRSKTSNDARRIASSINNILLYNPSSNNLLKSLPVVEAFSFIIPLAEDDEAVYWISHALKKILSNSGEAHQKFGTPEFFEIFKGMENHATSDYSKMPFRSVLGFVDLFDYSKPLANATNSSQLKSAVDALLRHEKYFSSRVRDLIITKKDLIVDAETADSVVRFLFSFSQDKSRRHLLQTKEVQDLTINHIAPHVTAIAHFGGLICNITNQNEPAAELYSNVESFTAILNCFHHSKTSDDAKWIATSINNILYVNPSSKTLLNSLPVVEAFSFIIPLANNGDAVDLIARALLSILNNNNHEARKKFATPEFLKIFKGMEQHATGIGVSAPIIFVGLYGGTETPFNIVFNILDR